MCEAEPLLLAGKAEITAAETRHAGRAIAG
jgi:hypothetical protein